MTDRGFFAIDRGAWDHPLFAKERFSEREAWFWLISSAAWEPMKVRVGRGNFDLERGQCAFALRFLATKWMWSEPRVRRFLKRLTDDAAVLVSATREATLITICNYNDYQSSRRTDVAQVDAPLNVKPTNPRRKEEETNNLTNKQTTKEDQQRKRAARLPADAVPNDRNQADAVALGMTASEIEQQWRRMRDWSASSTKGACLDWDARWRNWCETFLGGRNATGTVRTNQASGPPPTRDTAIIAGMGRALARRREARAADDPGREELRERGGAGPAAGDDAERGSKASDDGTSRQLTLIPGGYPRK